MLERRPLAVQTPSPAQLIQAIIDKGITEQSVIAVERLCDLHVKMDAIDAERAFTIAFVALQQETSSVRASVPVPNSDGSTRYSFAPFETIMAMVKPLLTKHGFAVTFDSTTEGDRVTQTCTLMHSRGHKRSNSFTARVGSGPPRSSLTQVDGAASTFAKRYALCNALNIVVEKDDDARNVGEQIPREKAEDLRRRVLALKANETVFLKIAQADSFENIQTGILPVLETMLAQKEKKP